MVAFLPVKAMVLQSHDGYFHFTFSFSFPLRCNAMLIVIRVCVTNRKKKTSEYSVQNGLSMTVK